MSRRRGFTMIELLIALVVLSIVVATATTAFRSQSKHFRIGSTKMETVQNMRYALGTLERSVRTMGSGTTPRQPMLVYGDANVIVFNANFASDSADGDAVYVNPDLPRAAGEAVTTDSSFTIFGTAITYPDTNYYWGPSSTPSRAETISFYFEPDASTPNPNDYILMQRLNNQPPELIARNLQAYPSRPFFEYWYDSLTATGGRVVAQVTGARIPIRHAAATHGGTADTAASALADSVRLVRVNFLGTNGLTNADSASRPISTSIGLPNNGLVQISTCGGRPILTSGLAATPNLPTDPPSVRLVWSPSVDETSGETDVSQYNVYYKLSTATDWEVFTIIPSGQNPYDITSGAGLVAGSTYDFAVGAQDCTPKESMLITSTGVFIP